MPTPTTTRPTTRPDRAAQAAAVRRMRGERAGWNTIKRALRISVETAQALCPDLPARLDPLPPPPRPSQARVPFPGRRVYDITRAAEVLGVMWHTASRWADSGRLPALTTPAGRRYLDADAVDAMRGNLPAHPGRGWPAGVPRRVRPAG